MFDVIQLEMTSEDQFIQALCPFCSERNDHYILSLIDGAFWSEIFKRINVTNVWRIEKTPCKQLPVCEVNMGPFQSHFTKSAFPGGLRWSSGLTHCLMDCCSTSFANQEDGGSNPYEGDIFNFQQFLNTCGISGIVRFVFFGFVSTPGE